MGNILQKIANIFSPVQGHSYVIDPSVTIQDATGPCEVIVTSREDGKIEYTHFEPEQRRREEIEYIREQQRLGRRVKRIGQNQQIEGTAKQIFENARQLTPVSNRMRR